MVYSYKYLYFYFKCNRFSSSIFGFDTFDCLTPSGINISNMIQNIIKKMLRKWLKKKLYNSSFLYTTNVARFKWVYDSPLRQWRDRIWVVKQCDKTIAGIDFLDKVLKEYLYN